MPFKNECRNSKWDLWRMLNTWGSIISEFEKLLTPPHLLPWVCKVEWKIHDNRFGLELNMLKAHLSLKNFSHHRMRISCVVGKTNQFWSIWALENWQNQLDTHIYLHGITLSRGVLSLWPTVLYVVPPLPLHSGLFFYLQSMSRGWIHIIACNCFFFRDSLVIKTWTWHCNILAFFLTEQKVLCISELISLTLRQK